MRNKEHGMGLLFALIATAVIALCIVTLANSVSRDFQASAYRAIKQKAVSKIENNLAADVDNLFTQSGASYLSTLASDTAATTHLLGGANTSVIVIERSLPELNYVDKRGIFLSFRNTFATPPHINWSAALNNRETLGLPCTNWTDEIQFTRNVVRPRSTQTCTELIPLSTNAAVYGNIATTNEVIIENVSSSKLQLIVLGYINISGALQLKNLNNATVDIIVGGEITISTISQENVVNTRLLLHSSRGPITFAYTDTNLSLCAANTSGQLLVSAEAHEDLTINGIVYGRNMTAGCPVQRDTNLWPKFLILGSS